MSKIKSLRQSRSKKGETITEVLVSILVVALSAAMLAVLISAAVSINIRADKNNDEFCEQLTIAETGTKVKSDDQKITVNGQDVNVTYYGKDDKALTSFEKRGG